MFEIFITNSFIFFLFIEINSLMPKITCLDDLLVWQESMEISKEIYAAIGKC